MKLVFLEKGQAFQLKGKTYRLDPKGRDGNGKRAVYDVDTKEKFMIEASADVSVIEEKEAETPDLIWGPVEESQVVSQDDPEAEATLENELGPKSDVDVEEVNPANSWWKQRQPKQD